METAIRALAILGLCYAAFKVLQKFGIFDDEFQKIARQEQRRANYPGCARGVMKCYDFCDCDGESYPRQRWIIKRANVLRQRARCKHLHIVPKFSRMFPELGPRGQQCQECLLVRETPDAPWKESDD